MQLAIILSENETEIVEDFDKQNMYFVSLKEKIRRIYQATDQEYIPIIGRDEDGELYDTLIDIEKL